MTTYAFTNDFSAWLVLGLHSTLFLTQPEMIFHVFIWLKRGDVKEKTDIQSELKGDNPNWYQNLKWY